MGKDFKDNGRNGKISTQNFDVLDIFKIKFLQRAGWRSWGGE